MKPGDYTCPKNPMDGDGIRKPDGFGIWVGLSMLRPSGGAF